MKKVILNLRHVTEKDEMYNLISTALDFPDYFGRNLDGLYDLLTEISADTCIGLFLPDFDEDLMVEGSFEEYLSRVCDTFTEAEDANAHLCVISCHC